MVPILYLVECQLIEAATASSTFPKLPPTNLQATDCHTRLWWKNPLDLFAPNSNTKPQHQGEDFPRFSRHDRLSHQTVVETSCVYHQFCGFVCPNIS